MTGSESSEINVVMNDSDQHNQSDDTTGSEPHD